LPLWNKEAAMDRKGSKSRATRTGRALLAVLLLAATQAVARTTGTQSAARPRRHVVVSLRHRKLAVLENGQIVRVFPVAVGARVSPSPAGQFEVINRIPNPTYFHPGTVIPPGNKNPIGTRWVGLNKKGYGIHGTNVPHSIGKAASHGCIRLRNHDVEELFEMVRVGDTVEITDQTDDKIAQIFGGEAAAPVPTVTPTGAGVAVSTTNGQ
jgi:lipoprotein-anchoring transpeptidase ErfK/SrfK